MDIVDTILHGDALQTLRTLPGGCVQCCVTSPPYWGLRDYGTARWVGGDPACAHRVGNQVRDHMAPDAIVAGVRPGADASRCLNCGATRIDAQLGLEATPDEYVARMVEVFREVRRVLRDDGTLWLNLGDSYNAYNGNAKRGGPIGLTQSAQRPHLPTGYGLSAKGLKPKDLIGVPWMVAFALRADGWYLRSDICWHKPNPMPESVRDRPTRSHEYIFLLSKRERYYYDADAIREPHTALGRPPGNKSRIYFDRDPQHHSGEKRRPEDAHSFHALGRNKRDVWTVATAPFPGSHFAVFPPALIEPCVLAGTSPRACETCGAPWARMTKRSRTLDGAPVATLPPMRNVNRALPSSTQGVAHWRTGAVSEHLGWQPTCRCLHNTGAGKSLVLDPFMGAGTVGVVARRHSRHYLGIELNQAYIEMANDRIAREVQPVLWTA